MKKRRISRGWNWRLIQRLYYYFSPLCSDSLPVRMRALRPGEKEIEHGFLPIGDRQRAWDNLPMRNYASEHQKKTWEREQSDTWNATSLRFIFWLPLSAKLVPQLTTSQLGQRICSNSVREVNFLSIAIKKIITIYSVECVVLLYQAREQEGTVWAGRF